MDGPVFSGCEFVDATLMFECAFETTMEPGPEHPVPTPQTPTPIPTPETRPVFPRSARRGPEHELKDRAKAAKLRHRAAKARLKANHLEERTRHLRSKADQMERRAGGLDGGTRPPARASLHDGACAEAAAGAASARPQKHPRGVPFPTF